MSTQKTYIVIGTSAAGLAAVQKIRQLDPLCRILCFSDELELPYNKCFLADFLSGRTEITGVYTKPASFFQSLSVELYLGVRVLSIDRTNRSITCSNGIIYDYTALLLAVGAAARKPLCRYKTGMSGLFSFHTLRDAQVLQAYAVQKKSVSSAVLGAGLTGLEVADALHLQGHAVTIIEQQPRILMRHLDEEGAAFVTRCLQRQSVSLLTGRTVEELISDDEGCMTSVRFSDGTIIPTKLVVAALGAIARLELSEAAGLTLEQGAVVTDDVMRTSDPAIFAAGDVALVKNALTGEKMRTALWPDAVSQGMHAACAMVGQSRPYRGVVPVATSTFFGTSFHSAGFLEASECGWIERIERTYDGYSKVVLDQQNVVKGFVCMGDLVSKTLSYKRSLVTGIPLE